MERVGCAWLGWKATDYVSELEHLAMRVPGLLEPYAHVLISHLDSAGGLTPELPSVRKLLEEGLALRGSADGLLTDGRTLVRLATDYRFFHGFDEVWFFDEAPRERLPNGVRINSIRPLEASTTFRYGEEALTIDDLALWMSRSGAALGLCDGAGLNFITTDQAVALRFMAL